MKRFLPLLVSLSVLIAASAGALALTGDGGDDSGRNSAEGAAGGDTGGAIAGICVEGVPDCVDMIVNGDGDVTIGGGDVPLGECELIPDLEGCLQPPGDIQPPIRSDEGIDPNECNLIHNIDACEAGVFSVAIDFNEAVTQADMDVAQEVLGSFDPGVQLLILESFPPMGRATVRSSDPAFCEMVQAKLSGLAGVRAVTCEPAAPPADGAPDAPVSSTP